MAKSKHLIPFERDDGSCSDIVETILKIETELTKLKKQVAKLDQWVTYSSSAQCPICLSPFQDKISLPKQGNDCGHSFCRECLKAYFKHSNAKVCPICDIPVNILL